MRRSSSVLLIALTTSICFSQPREGKTHELSLSGSYQNFSSPRSSSSTSAFLVSPRLGFFVFEGLEIEPELLLMLSSGATPVYLLNGNVSYNFLSTKKAVPFLLLGYGLANTVPFLNVPTTRTDFNIGVLNVGVGLKNFLNEDVAIRVEYRFQKFTGEGNSTTHGFYSYAEKVDIRSHLVEFGLSVLL